MEAALRIRLVRENLAVAIALRAAAQRGVINCSFVPARTEVEDDDGKDAEASDSLVVQDSQELVRCTSNQLRGAFALSVMQAHQALTTAFGDSPLEETDPDLKAARCAMLLLHRTLSADTLAPVWDCPSQYREPLEVEPVSFSLDPAAVNGQEVFWDDFGGLTRFLALLEYCADRVAQQSPAAPAAAAEEEPPEAPSHFGSRNGLGGASYGYAAEDGAETSPADSVGAFIQACCAVDPEEKIIARSLYDTYLDWCRERDITPLPQRSFGMRLTGLGFERRRRGRGRHWWLGIGLARVQVG